MLSQLIFAGGRGSRMYGDAGGCKALVQLPDGSALIDYLLTEARELDVDERIVLGSPFTCAGLEGHMAVLGYPGRVVNQPQQGTGRAICDLIELAQGEVLIVTAGDVVGPRGAVGGFFEYAVRRVQDAREPLCVVAAGRADPADDSPTFIEADETGVVRAIGKDLDSAKTFVGVRVMNRSFADLVVAAWADGRTDTVLLREVMRTRPGSVEYRDCPGIFDIDLPSDLARTATA